MSGIDFSTLNKSCQIIHDCYLVSSIKALNSNDFGRKMLSKSIRISELEEGREAYEVIFHGVKGKNKFIINPEKDMKRIYWRKNFDLLSVIESSMDKVIKAHPFLKPLISRLFSPLASRVEYNSASKFMYMLTGISPLQIGERGILPLSYRKSKALDLLNRVSGMTNDEFSLVTATLIDGCKKGLADNHYYIIAGANINEKKVFLGNPRKPENIQTISLKNFFNNFRSITGYFDNMIKP